MNGKTLRYKFHQKTKYEERKIGNKSEVINKRHCENGPSCRYKKENRCYYSHQYEEKCKNGPTCRYLERNACSFKHEENERHTIHKPRKLCENGQNCEYLKKGCCRYNHDESTENKDNHEETVQKQKCRNGNDCQFLKRGICRYEHDKDTENESKDKKKDNHSNWRNGKSDEKHRERNEVRENKKVDDQEKYKDTIAPDNTQQNFLENRIRKKERRKTMETEEQPWSNFY